MEKVYKTKKKVSGMEAQILNPGDRGRRAKRSELDTSTVYIKSSSPVRAWIGKKLGRIGKNSPTHKYENHDSNLQYLHKHQVWLLMPVTLTLQRQWVPVSWLVSHSSQDGELPDQMFCFGLCKCKRWNRHLHTCILHAK